MQILNDHSMANKLRPHTTSTYNNLATLLKFR